MFENQTFLLHYRYHRREMLVGHRYNLLMVFKVGFRLTLLMAQWLDVGAKNHALSACQCVTNLRLLRDCRFVGLRKGVIIVKY